MLPDTVQFFSAFFSSVWRLMTSFYIPGTNVTPGAMFLGVLAIAVLYKFLKRIMFNDNSEESTK